MKELINIENWGVRLYYIEPIDCDLLIEWRDAYKRGQYLFEYDDTCAPEEHQIQYKTLEEALGDIVNYILNPDNIYAMDEQPDNLQKAFALAGVPLEQNPIHPEITESVATFLYYILEGIAETNMRKEN